MRECRVEGDLALAPGDVLGDQLGAAEEGRSQQTRASNRAQTRRASVASAIADARDPQHSSERLAPAPPGNGTTGLQMHSNWASFDIMREQDSPAIGCSLEGDGPAAGAASLMHLSGRMQSWIIALVDHTSQLGPVKAQ